MNIKRRQELLEQYKNRRPQMGVVKILCKPTQDTFYDLSKDTKATINSNIAKLKGQTHPNKYLTKLWQEHGQDAFEFSCVKELKYKNVDDDHQEKLEKLREEILASDKKGQKVWK